MAFNGSGVFQRLYNWTNDAAANIKIRADRMDNEMNGFSTGLSTCITKDGQTTVTANLPMAGFNHTGVGAGSARTDYTRLDQTQDGKLAWVDGGGTADAIAANYAIPITTLVDGQLCYVRATAANATTTPTFSPSSLTARTIVKSGGVALGIGDISADGHELILRYDLANTRWELLNPAVSIPYTAASSGSASKLDFYEDTDNGTNKVTLLGPASIGSDSTLQLPGTGTLATLAGTETFTNKTITAPTITGATVTTSSVNGVTLTTGGSATQFLNGVGSYAVPDNPIKAWVNFNGTGTVAIRASFNVSSITDNGTGDYTVNFTNALSDANYAIIGTVGDRSAADSPRALQVSSATAPTASACRVVATVNGAGAEDQSRVSVSFLR